MDKLHSVTNETISLDIMTGMIKIRLKEIISKHSISYMDKKNYEYYMWAGATGKALLSLLDERELDMVFHFFELIPLTPNTITDPEVLKKNLIEYRRQGVAFDHGEMDEDVHTIAAPVFNYQKMPVAAAVVVVPAKRTADKRVKAKLAKSVKETAALISSRLFFKEKTNAN